MPDETGSVLVEDGPGARWITLSRSAKLNALDAPTLAALGQALAQARADSGVRVLVLTGAGRAFCAGADLSAVAGEGRDRFLTLLHETLASVRGFPRPVIGALNGVTAAGGLELALCCDLLVASAGAPIGDAHIRHGLIPGAGSATILPRRLGPQRAKQMLLTGGFETAETLRDWGLVNWVVPPEELVPFTAALAVSLAEFSPAALAAMKALANAAAGPDLLGHEASATRAHLASADAAEGLAAFRDKREPDFGIDLGKAR